LKPSHAIEYGAAWLILASLGVLPRPFSRQLAGAVLQIVYFLTPRLRKVAQRNLGLALPDLGTAERIAICRGTYRSLGRLLAECAKFPSLKSANLDQIVSFAGLDNYEAAVRKGRGVVFLTAHLGAWELGAFAHALRVGPLHIVYRALDNPLLDRLANRYRTLSGNLLIEKSESARGILGALARNETVGILADQNTLPEEGVFVDFFGLPACTTAGIARFALRGGAAVVPAFCVWDQSRRRFKVVYEPALELEATGDAEKDLRSATQQMTSVVERYVRRYPDQWLWIHRRWKTRPPGHPPLYD
jgi:KDO2-lipid IV(A) lauroyltransferase